jgi:hypothetical protein
MFHDRASGVLQHMTIGITEVKNVHSPTEYKYWTLPQFDSPPLAEADKKYYLYAKCSKSETTGVFVLSETAIGMEAVAGYYHFLVALVNSEYNGDRSVVALYGFSEVLPGRITTDRIVSADGDTYFDLANSEIGGRIDFKDGLVSGDIGIGNEKGINAGMSGAGNADTDIRLWAGATKENKENAPFRVMQDGSVEMSKADIKSSLSSEKYVSIKNGNIAAVSEVGSMSFTFSDNGTPEILASAGLTQSEINAKEIRIVNTYGFLFSINGSYGLKYIYRDVSINGSRTIQITFDETNYKTIFLLENLPTSASGLKSGQVWRNGSVLNIVP